MHCENAAVSKPFRYP